MCRAAKSMLVQKSCCKLLQLRCVNTAQSAVRGVEHSLQGAVCGMRI
jgi:hypothetical protein